MIQRVEQLRELVASGTAQGAFDLPDDRWLGIIQRLNQGGDGVARLGVEIGEHGGCRLADHFGRGDGQPGAGEAITHRAESTVDYRVAMVECPGQGGDGAGVHLSKSFLGFQSDAVIGVMEIEDPFRKQATSEGFLLMVGEDDEKGHQARGSGDQRCGEPSSCHHGLLSEISKAEQDESDMIASQTVVEE
jgi:hypothetical protein